MSLNATVAHVTERILRRSAESRGASLNFLAL